ncbi:hypothetical protein F5887DRAFT_970288 [Amanita rubescens]|nr:hypothetical protein F5887DRAFT_970288 [Amanita rubescens]
MKIKVLQLAVIVHAAPFDSDTVYHCPKGYSCCGPIIDGVGGTVIIHSPHFLSYYQPPIFSCYYAGGSEDFNCPMY